MSMDFHFQAHFEPQMFTTTTGGKRVLAHNAVPTIFGPPLPKMPRQQQRQQPRPPAQVNAGQIRAQTNFRPIRMKPEGFSTQNVIPQAITVSQSGKFDCPLARLVIEKLLSSFAVTHLFSP